MKALIFARRAVVLLSRRGPSSAKKLVYCSEGSPDGFIPRSDKTGTLRRGAAVYNRSTDSSVARSDIVPGLAESWEVIYGPRP